MNYIQYFLEELKKRIFILFFLLIVLITASFFVKEISIAKISLTTLLFLIFICSLLAALIRYFNNGRDIWGNY
jgi:uncharacterized membrane protein